MQALSMELPDNVPYVFISSITNFGVSTLKDLLWRELNSEDLITNYHYNKESLVHRQLDVSSLEFEPEDIIISEETDIEDDFEYDEENF